VDVSVERPHGNTEIFRCCPDVHDLSDLCHALNLPPHSRLFR
jgi:hypothetical protein